MLLDGHLLNVTHLGENGVPYQEVVNQTPSTVYLIKLA